MEQQQRSIPYRPAPKAEPSLGPTMARRVESYLQTSVEADPWLQMSRDQLSTKGTPKLTRHTRTARLVGSSKGEEVSSADLHCMHSVLTDNSHPNLIINSQGALRVTTKVGRKNCCHEGLQLPTLTARKARMPRTINLLVHPMPHPMAAACFLLPREVHVPPLAP